MAMDMFLKVPGIVGESKDATHKEEIDLLAWSWGAGNSGTSHMGGGAGAGKVDVQDISITKYVDKSSPNLMMAVCNGKHFAEAYIYVRKAGETPLEYMKYKLEEVMVTSYSTGGSGGEDRLTENVTLNFAKVHFEYVPQKDDGSPDSSSPVGWDIPANVKI